MDKKKIGILGIIGMIFLTAFVIIASASAYVAIKERNNPLNEILTTNTFAAGTIFEPFIVKLIPNPIISWTDEVVFETVNLQEEKNVYVSFKPTETIKNFKADLVACDFIQGTGGKPTLEKVGETVSISSSEEATIMPVFKIQRGSIGVSPSFTPEKKNIGSCTYTITDLDDGYVWSSEVKIKEQQPDANLIRLCDGFPVVTSNDEGFAICSYQQSLTFSTSSNEVMNNIRMDSKLAQVEPYVVETTCDVSQASANNYETTDSVSTIKISKTSSFSSTKSCTTKITRNGEELKFNFFINDPTNPILENDPAYNWCEKAGSYGYKTAILPTRTGDVISVCPSSTTYNIANSNSETKSVNFGELVIAGATGTVVSIEKDCGVNSPITMYMKRGGMISDVPTYISKEEINQYQFLASMTLFNVGIVKNHAFSGEKTCTIKITSGTTTKVLPIKVVAK